MHNIPALEDPVLIRVPEKVGNRVPFYTSTLMRVSQTVFFKFRNFFRNTGLNVRLVLSFSGGLSAVGGLWAF
jgi:hypothetical protein